MADEQEAVREPFTLFGLEWRRRAFVSYADWAAWYEGTSTLTGLMEFFVEPPVEAFREQTDIADMDARMLELWRAVRNPPAEGNG